MTLQQQMQQRREFLTKELLNLKSDTLRVFICNNSDYAYGMVTDNKNIIGIDTVMDLRAIVFTTTFEYTKSKTTGSCCSAMNPETGYCYQHLTKEAFYESVHNGSINARNYKATPYADFEDYVKKNPWEIKNFTEL